MQEKVKFSYFLNSTVGVGILSWKSYSTLEKSLQSYEKIGFKDFFDDVKIIFQEISDKDRKLAKKYGYDYIGLEKNVGIQEGHKEIYKNIKTDYILVLENDNPVIVTRELFFERINKSLEFLDRENIDIMRLRHRWNFGEGFSLDKYFNLFRLQNIHEKYNHKIYQTNFINEFLKVIKRTFNPRKVFRIAGYSLYCEKYPEKIFPAYIEKIEEDFYIVSSKIMTWTNQSVLLKRDLYGKLLNFAENNSSSRTANGFQDLEKPLNCNWWREQSFNIGISEGVFTHNRFDDSWRLDHHAYNKGLKKENFKNLLSK
uniref:hypothetical protein n=1 Tax=Aliarcobacter sp. TaxID=2321116 RepID=UPI004048464B